MPELEEKFDVRFSYLEKDLDNIQVNLPTNLKQLDDVLNFLRDQTSLSFILLNDRYIAIRKTRTEEIFCFILKDSNTDLPISGAGVFNINGDLINFSNEAGEVVLKDSDIDKNIVIRHLGYNPVELKQEITSYRHCPEVLMIPFVEVLGESVIVNYLTTGISRRRDGSTMINTDNFGTLPGMVEPDILHILEALPGVENANETISSINIRGGTSDQNLVLYDGVKMYLTGHFFGLISAFNPGLTNKARLVKNGTSSEFGGGVSGTIDISSKNELTGKISGGAGISLVNADAYLQVPLANNLEVHLSGRRSIDNFYRSPTFSSYFSRAFQESAVFTGGDRVSGEGADFNFQDYSGKILYNFRDNHKFRLTGLIIENKLNYIENLSGPGDATERINSLAQKNLVIGGSLISNWSKNLGTTFRSYLTRYSLSALNKNTATEQSLIQSNEVLETGVKLSLKYSLSSRSVLHGGYEFSEAGVSNIEVVNNPFFSSRIKNVLRSHSVFTEMTVEQEQFFIRGGLRLNYLDRLEKFLLEPRVNINYKVSQSINFTVQGEQKSQTLSQIIDLQEDFLGVENRRWILANGREFPVVRSNQVSMGVDFKSAGWFVDLETYYKKVEGINTSTQGFRDQHEFRRTKGSYDSKGVELLVNKKLKDLQVYLNYTLAESSYEFPALESSYFPNNLDIRHSFSLAMNYSFDNLIFSLGGKAASGKPFTAPVEDQETWQEGNLWFVNYDSPNAVNFPFYFRLDASASYNFKISEKLKGEFNAGVINLTNRENIINRYYRVDEENPSTAIQVDEKSLGFTPNILFRIIF
ncbi:TonB-dependent receptor plug domain-containing protein [Salinimicrobium terrae]|uniref:TonB-dependent receptor plug domain-containing protein n=1 Tax=Salinimicrobium terrae TaxID=470866 RepID=UPI00146DC69D|nr:TonB-dependent receptor plug domain-containing protein [Salinimicrobium terrae]